MFGTMFRSFQQLKIPLIQPYLPIKCMSLRTQAYPKVFRRPSSEQLPSVQSAIVGHPPELETFQDAFLRNESLPYNVISDTKITEFMESSQQFSTASLYSIPCRTKSQQKSCTEFDGLNETRDLGFHSRDIVRHNVVALSEGNRNSHSCVNFVNQNERLSPNFDKFSSAKRRGVLLYSSGNKSAREEVPSGRPSEDQLLKIQDGLVECLPKFFYSSHNYNLYNKNVVFHNNISGVTKRGLLAYGSHLSMVRFLATLKYTHTKMNVLKVTNHPEDGTVRIRWRISGVSGLKPIYMFWKFHLGSMKSSTEEEWTDGFSVFYVGSDGLIYKHICDKIMPDDNVEKVMPGALGSKIAVGLGLFSNADYFPVGL